MTQGNEKLLVESSSRRLDDEEVLSLAGFDDTRSLMSVAGAIRDVGHQNTVSYSRKVFIPLTHLCRDVCHYCTFAQVPRKLKAPYLTPDEVLKIAQDGAKAGCKKRYSLWATNPSCVTKRPGTGLKS